MSREQRPDSGGTAVTPEPETPFRSPIAFERQREKTVERIYAGISRGTFPHKDDRADQEVKQGREGRSAPRCPL